MKIGAFEILLFFVCLNLACFVLHTMEALPYAIEATETPESIVDRFYSSLGGSIAILAGGSLAGVILGSLAYGASIALVIAALNLLFPIFEWIFLGFPKFLQVMGVPEVIYLVVSVVVSITWVWFLIGIVAQRYME